MLVPVLQKDWTIVLKNPAYEDVTDYIDTITEANRNDDIAQPWSDEPNKLEVAEFKKTIRKVTK